MQNPGVIPHHPVAYFRPSFHAEMFSEDTIVRKWPRPGPEEIRELPEYSLLTLKLEGEKTKPFLSFRVKTAQRCLPDVPGSGLTIWGLFHHLVLNSLEGGGEEVTEEVQGSEDVVPTSASLLHQCRRRCPQSLGLTTVPEADAAHL